MYSNLQPYIIDRKPPLGALLNPHLSINQGLVLNAPFNEGSGKKVYDLSGNNNDGTITGDVSWVAGKSGSALEFPGTDDYVSTTFNPNRDIGNGNPFTIISVVYPHDVTAAQHTIMGGNIATPRFYLTSFNSLWFWGIGSTYDVDTGCTATANVWQQVALVYEGGLKNVRIYLDGIEKYNAAYTGDGALPDDVANIGIYYDLANDFDGQIDHVMVYNRALSASEIASLYREPFCGFQWTNIMQLASYVAAAGGILPQITTAYMKVS